MMVALLQRVAIAIQYILKGDLGMMAMFFAQRIIMGKLTYAVAVDKVPLLAEQIKEVLVDSGLGDLAE